MHIVISQFEIANGMEAAVKNAFRDRPHLVDDAPGFLRLDVISAKDTPSEIMLITFWQDEQSYKIWHRSHDYRASHAGIPKGLKLRQGKTRIRAYEHVSS